MLLLSDLRANSPVTRICRKTLRPCTDPALTLTLPQGIQGKAIALQAMEGWKGWKGSELLIYKNMLK